ncbi:MAG: putative porin [Bacteroidaceae bacterium]|nr:putative porin [Bacteroidaceae bacterium]
MRTSRFILLLLALCVHLSVHPQSVLNGVDDTSGGFLNSGDDSEYYDANGQKRSTWGRDTSKVDRTVPTEFFQWRIDERLGTVLPEEYNDTLPHLFQNWNATDGLYGEYNYLGNLGAPRLARNFLDREAVTDFMFTQNFDYYHTSPGNFLFTNTKSPLTNLQYHSCGTKENGQDRVRAYFATNINKLAGIGFKIDYLFGRGYYLNQQNSQFGGTLYGYYRGEHYDMHAMASWEHLKMGENGGIEDETYITNPQSFPQSYSSRDIPTVLSDVYNRNDQQTYYLTHRYSLGIYHDLEVPDSLKPVMPQDQELLMRIKSDSLRDVIKADTLLLSATLDSLKTQWQNEQVTPQEFIPVTSFIHTLHIKRLTHNNYVRNSGIPSTYLTHDPYYRSSYSSFSDETKAISVKNTLGLQLREGFNKWAKAGVTLFASHEFKRFNLPSLATNDTLDAYEHYTENHLSVGGELLKSQGHTLHYRAGAEFWVVGPDAGDMELYGNADLNFRLGKDTVRFEANAFIKNVGPAFYFDHFHSQTHWWDNSMDRETRTRLEGRLAIDRTATSLRFGVENLTNYTYFASLLTPNYASDGTTISSYGHDVEARQHSSNIQVLSATLHQDLHLGIFHWDNEVTWQASSNQDVLPLPALSIYTNPYIAFHIAKVLRVELGADMRYFTRYYAPDYAPFVQQFVVQDATQERTKIGHYPILNAYANFAIKRVRGYINVKHFNQSTGHYFWAPRYPVDPFSIHFGISWNFYD